jgi:hypothetical protein
MDTHNSSNGTNNSTNNSHNVRTHPQVFNRHNDDGDEALNITMNLLSNNLAARLLSIFPIGRQYNKAQTTLKARDSWAWE